LYLDTGGVVRGKPGTSKQGKAREWLWAHGRSGATDHSQMCSSCSQGGSC
jgi:hypothetical protein